MSEKLLRKNFYEKVLAFSPKREYLIEVKNDGVLPVMGRTPSFVPGETSEMRSMGQEKA